MNFGRFGPSSHRTLGVFPPSGPCCKSHGGPPPPLQSCDSLVDCFLAGIVLRPTIFFPLPRACIPSSACHQNSLLQSGACRRFPGPAEASRIGDLPLSREGRSRLLCERVSVGVSDEFPATAFFKTPSGDLISFHAAVVVDLFLPGMGLLRASDDLIVIKCFLSRQNVGGEKPPFQL